MKLHEKSGASTDAMEPLIRAIGTELAHRARSIQFLETRLEAFQSTPGIHADDILNLKAELAVHKCELRLCLAELEKLGCTLDLEDPARILGPSGVGRGTAGSDLDDTQFRRTLAN